MSNLHPLTHQSENKPLVQEIIPNTQNKKVQHILSQEFLPGSFNYKGLVLKYYKMIDPETGKNIGTPLPDVPTRVISMHTPNIIERLTGLCLQLGLMTLESFDRVIRSGGFYQNVEKAQTFTPSPELEETLNLLLKLEAIFEPETRVQQLVALEELQWKRYIILHKARNKILVDLLGKLPGLIPDSAMRAWFIVTLNSRMPVWVAEAQERRTQSFLYTQLNS